MPWTASPYAVGQPAGQLGWRAPFSTVLVTPSMVAIATVLSPTVLVGFIITPPAMAGVAVFRAPTVTSTATLTVPPMQATAVLLAPFLGTVIPVAVPVLPATAQFRTPTVAAGASVTSPLMQALAALLAPAVSTAYAELPPTMTAAALMPAPAVASGAGVASPLMLAAAALLTPTITIGGPILPPPMAALAAMPTPAVSSSVAIGAAVTVPTFDAVGDATNLAQGASISWNHTATAGAQVLLFCDIQGNVRTITSVTYGSLAMTPQGSVNLNNNVGNGTFYLYSLSGAPGGSQTVTVTFNGAANAAGNTVSYTGVNNVGTLSTTYGSSTVPSQALTCSTNQMIVQAFGDVTTPLSAVSGGTPRGAIVTGNTTSVSVGIQDSTASTTFSAAISTAHAYGGIGVVLSGGVGGAPLMAATAGMPAPTVAATAAVTIPAPLLQAVAAIAVPTVNVGTGVAITAPVLHATAAMPTPTVNVVAGGPTYGATGTGAAIGGSSATTFTWTHTATAGSNIIAALMYNTGPVSIKYGSSSMTQIGSNSTDSSGNIIAFYRLTGAPSGAQTVTVTCPAFMIGAGNTVSAAGVNSVGTPTSANDGGAPTTSLSQPVTCAANQLIIQAFADSGAAATDAGIAATSGGIRRSLTTLATLSPAAAILSVSTATATTTFTATQTAADTWAGIAVVLS
jgi:hypothetical protein